MAGAYSGAATRAAHFASRPPVPGVNADHITPDPEPDPFNPVPDKVTGQGGTVWSGSSEGRDAGQSNMPNLAQVPVSHWWQGRPPLPSNVAEAVADQELQNRFVANHAVTNVIPDSIRLYLHATQGRLIQWSVGRAPREAGISVPENAKWLMVGKNGYDATNEPTEVYSGAPANVGRYRLGERLYTTGLYEMPLAKNGQDAQLHSYTPATPQFPADASKPRMTNTAPYTAPSGGAGRWIPAPHYQVPSMFALPSETTITDYRAAEGYASDFVDRGEFF